MAYTVHCPSCSTEFPVDPAKVPEDGVNARCSSCTEVFFVEKPGATEAASGGVAAPEFPLEIPQEESPGFEELGVEEGGADESPGFGEPAVEELEADESPGFEELAVEEEAPLEEGFPGEGEEPAFAESPEAAPPGFSSDVAATDEVEVEEEDFVLEQETLYAEPGAEEEEPETPSGEAPPGLAGTGEAAAPAGPVQFGQRTPEEKAQRLARVLVSDMILYNPQRHTRAIENGTLAEEFEDEIKKSWEEYVEQVGDGIAENTSYFTEALNEILAKGEEIF